MVFSFTGVFSKAAANAYNAGSFTNPRLYLFVFLMLSVCAIYAIAWQIVIKDISLHVAYANKSVYLIWGQIWAVCIATFFSAGSQVLLKQSAKMEHKSWIYEYLNWRVITAYAIAFAVLFLNTWAFTKIDMRFGSVIDTVTYVFVMLLSYFLLKEKFNKKQLIGNLVIIAGVLTYTL